MTTHKEKMEEWASERLMESERNRKNGPVQPKPDRLPPRETTRSRFRSIDSQYLSIEDVLMESGYYDN